MPSTLAMAVDPAPTPRPWIHIEDAGPGLIPSGSDLVHQYTTDVKTLAEPEWVYLEVSLIAHQIHPATVAELAALGPVGGDNAKRWTIEGPLMHRPGDPGEATNCTMKLELAYSTDSTPGSNWRLYRPDRYKLRSVQARLTVTRPSTAYEFRINSFRLRAVRIPRELPDHRTGRVFHRG